MRKKRIGSALVGMLTQIAVSIQAAVRSGIYLRPTTFAAWSLMLCLPIVAGAVDAQTQGKVDRLFAQWNRVDSPGAAVVVVKDGAVVYQHGYGSADLEQHVPITPQTVFDAASVAKQFTGLAVAMLVRQGKLSLDDDIRKYVPTVPDFGKSIAIQNLLHHTSGLRDWPETLALSGINMEGPITLDTILEMVHRQRELDFAPGDEFQYSNTGYNLLAAAIAKITGRSFRTWTDANLFQPLGMTHAFVCDNPAEIVPNRARSYSADQGKFFEVASRLAAPGSSSLFISTEDMGKWLLNFETARVGGEVAIAMMQQPAKLDGGLRVAYGFGLEWDQYRGMKVISHTGRWAGYRSVVKRFPQKHLSIAILANVDNLDPDLLSTKVAELYLNLAAENEMPASVPKSHGRGIQAPKSRPTDSTTGRLTAYVGDYWSEELMSVARLEIHDGKLAYRDRTGTWTHFLPSRKDYFDAEGVGPIVALEFTRNSASEVTGVKLWGNRVRHLRYARVVLPRT